MLTAKQKAFLRGIAHKEASVHQLGKNEISPESLEVFSKALLAHELVKIHVLKAAATPINELALDLAGPLKAEIVQIIGKNIVLYKANPQERKIKLPA